MLTDDPFEPIGAKIASGIRESKANERKAEIAEATAPLLAQIAKLEARLSAAPAAPAAQPEPTLWAIYVPGPDDVHAAPSEDAAHHMAAKHNAAMEQFFKAHPDKFTDEALKSSALASVCLWPHDADSHAEELKDFDFNVWGLSKPESAAPAAQHPDDEAVDKFATTMKTKLALAREKGRGGWQMCSQEELSRMLREHVEKGDPQDVANFCMFLWSLGHGIAAAPAAQPERAPMTREQEEQGWVDECSIGGVNGKIAFRQGVRYAERHHGIKEQP